jgi:hypothetical protein
MSLTATWMMMKDKKIYKDPVIFDKSGLGIWYICVDDDEPIEFVVFKWKKFSKKERELAISALLKSLGVNAEIISHQESGSRLFPPDWKEMQPAISAFIKLNEPLDNSKYNLKFDDVKDNINEIKNEGVFYTFS